jgi:restriction system protein
MKAVGFNMPKRNDTVFEMLVELPWWASVIFASFVFVGLRFILPGTMKTPIFSGAAQLVSSNAMWIALFFLLPGAISALTAWRRGELLMGQTSLSTIRNLSWRGLEDLVSEAYRRNGYTVMGNSGSGPDGGVDLVARMDGETVLVQCKQWKARRIGVRTVREMFGVLNAEKANEVHIVSSGYFTHDARAFARHKPIRLIDGPMLVQLIMKAQSPIPKSPPFAISHKVGAGRE